MSHKFELIVKLFLSYIFLLLLCFLFYALIVLPVTEAEKVNAIIGLFGWSATIYAPIAAYILLDNWKAQNHYTVIINIIIEMLDEIENFSKAITTLRNTDIYDPLFENHIDFNIDLNKLQFDLHDYRQVVVQHLSQIEILENKIKLIQNKNIDNPVFGVSLSHAKDLSLNLYSDIVYIYLICYKHKKEIYDRGDRPKTFFVKYANEDFKKFINLSYMHELMMGSKLNYKFSERQTLVIEELNNKVMLFRKNLD
ncbi:hypothetical protein [Acinetobacter baumannii]|uniref:hypothetical protein n=1 Tax=Acinetobacter baumannii TaxID=470 RepID=UPI0002CDC866|nr:hypothetical protein [Acinetobacter baumannii]ENW61761.1 hypothetical protein F915_01477 [Acinetobacter baumannii NIPH 70]MDB0076689.1 hypothetical protein [Acinetobacter baumannii]MDC4334368.1 hypothetical protein [Acinetobacter baumannii]MDC4804923.1 hypothetical protein [Acinetobacter baumannii]MDC5220285.1 hypothetical protein [Acinetobacter baumannii]